MNLDVLTSFFMWCTILNIALMLFTLVMLMVAKGPAYRMQKKLFPLSDEQLDLVMYCFLATHKVLIIVFNVMPLFALLIIGR